MTHLCRWHFQHCRHLPLRKFVYSSISLLCKVKSHQINVWIVTRVLKQQQNCFNNQLGYFLIWNQLHLHLAKNQHRIFLPTHYTSFQSWCLLKHKKFSFSKQSRTLWRIQSSLNWQVRLKKCMLMCSKQCRKILWKGCGTKIGFHLSQVESIILTLKRN